VSTTTLARFGGLAAIAGGALRTLSSFVPYDPSTPHELLYLAIDLLLLFGILGVYAVVRESAGLLGFVGFVLALSGTAAIVGPDGRLGPVDVYQAGSSVLVAGLVLLAVGTWRTASLPRWVSALWIATFVLGLANLVVPSAVLFAAAGIAFGLGLVGAGLRVWKT
jgi:hypothetical protein